jgi:hypothetical protein
MTTYWSQNEPRVPAEAPQPVAGPMIGVDPHIQDVSPLSDPFGSGLLGSSAAPLMYRRPPSPGGHDIGGSSGAAESPLDLSSVHEVVGAATGGSEDGESGGEEAPPKQSIPGAPDPVRQGIYSGPGGNLFHARQAPDGTTVVSHVGAPGDGLVP